MSGFSDLSKVEAELNRKRGIAIGQRLESARMNFLKNTTVSKMIGSKVKQEKYIKLFNTPEKLDL